MTSLLCVQAHVGVHAGCHGSVLSCQRRLTLHEWRPVGYAYQPWLRGGVCADVTCMCVCVCGDGGGWGGGVCANASEAKQPVHTHGNRGCLCLLCQDTDAIRLSKSAAHCMPQGLQTTTKATTPSFFSRKLPPPDHRSWACAKGIMQIP